VNSPAQHNSKPPPSHYTAGKRSPRYLSGTMTSTFACTMRVQMRMMACTHIATRIGPAAPLTACRFRLCMVLRWQNDHLHIEKANSSRSFLHRSRIHGRHTRYVGRSLD
jgi:hypothetical protein